MVGYASTQAQAKKMAPPASRGEAQDEAAVAKSPSAPPPLTADGVDRMYNQLVKIHIIATAQLVECAHWHRADSTSLLAQVETSRPRSGTEPSMIKLAPSPPTDFSSKAHYGDGRDGAMSLRFIAELSRATQARCLVAVNRGHDKTDRVTSSKARSNSHATLPPSTPLDMRRSCSAPYM
jgi:hypothetical protein